MSAKDQSSRTAVFCCNASLLKELRDGADGSVDTPDVCSALTATPWCGALGSSRQGAVVPRSGSWQLANTGRHLLQIFTACQTLTTHLVLVKVLQYSLLFITHKLKAQRNISD